MKKRILLAFAVVVLFLGIGFAVAEAELSQSLIEKGNEFKEPDINLSPVAKMGQISKNNTTTDSIRDLNPILYEFDKDMHQKQLVYLEEVLGLDTKEATKEAFYNHLEHLALLNKAKDMGITASDEEAKKRSSEEREYLESSNSDGVEESKEYIQNLIKGLRITEEEYWQEFVINGYKQGIMIEKMREKVLKGMDEQKRFEEWQKFVEKTIKEFKTEESGQIDSFKSEIGL